MQTDCLLANPRRLPLAIHSGSGCYVFDAAGRRYLDLVSGIGVNALGYNHPQITAAILDQAQLCIHTSNLYANPYQAALARELCRISGLQRAVFTNSGTEATEAALKLALCYGRVRHPKKCRFVAVCGGFHGRTRGALSVAGQDSLRAPFAPYGTEVTVIPPDEESALEAVDERTAALILEPVLGEGGVHPLRPAFLQAARDITRRHDALFIADEVQSGLGRTGANFAFEWAGIQPDIVTVAKPLAAGLPLGAVLFSEPVKIAFPPGTHASTFAGGPLACRVALEFLSMLPDLLPHIRGIGEKLSSGLESLRSRCNVIQCVRSRGLMIGIQLHTTGQRLVRRALERGLLINCTHENVLRLLPPYILTGEQVAEGLQMLEDVLAAV